MSAVAFDTLRFTRRLKAAGVPERQAEVEADAINEAFSEALDAQVATKSDVIKLDNKIDTVAKVLDNKIDTVAKALDNKIDTTAQELRAEIQEVKAELKADIHEVKAELKGDIHEVKSEQRLMKWMLVLIVIVEVVPLLKVLLPD